jgi:hypothetical protein
MGRLRVLNDLYYDDVGLEKLKVLRDYLIRLSNSRDIFHYVYITFNDDDTVKALEVSIGKIDNIFAFTDNSLDISIKVKTQ